MNYRFPTLILLSFLLSIGQLASVWHSTQHLQPASGSPLASIAAPHIHTDHEDSLEHRLQHLSDFSFVHSTQQTIPHQDSEAEDCLAFHLFSCQFFQLSAVTEFVETPFNNGAQTQRTNVNVLELVHSTHPIRGPPSRS